MSRITGVYQAKKVEFTRGGHTFVFRYYFRATLVRHIAALVEKKGISIPDAALVHRLSLDLEWQSKGV